VHDLPWWGSIGIALLNVCGYVIFRGANIQKHRFRKDPARPVWGRPPFYIKTSQGSLLLISGWWGLARHMNYFGDLLMGLAWCVTCSFGSPLPYFYVAYLVVLVVQGDRRDNSLCAARYGEAWAAYCRAVPYRIIPLLY
jgi:Delta14-sterol reductase